MNHELELDRKLGDELTVLRCRHCGAIYRRDRRWEPERRSGYVVDGRVTRSAPPCRRVVRLVTRRRVVRIAA